MKFKLNGLEKFLIRHKFPIIIITACIFLIVVYSLVFNGLILVALISIPIYWLVSRLLVNVSMIKNNQILKIRNSHLDLNEALNATNQLIDIINIKDFQSLAVLCNNRIAFLIEMGEFQKAESEIRIFWQSFNIKKILSPTLVAIHTNMAAIALEKRDLKTYEEQFRLVCHYNQKITNKVMKRHSDFAISNLTQNAESVVANENSNAESYTARVWQTTRTDSLKGKILSDDEITPHSYLTVYEKLFNFSKNKGDLEKTKAYAEHIVNIANEQFYIYRKAKEYLENANRSN